MTFWTVVLAGFIGGIVSAVVLLAVELLGYWLARKRGVV